MPLLWVYCRCGTGGSYCGIGCCCWHAADKDDVSGHALLLQNVVILITTTIDVILIKKTAKPLIPNRRHPPAGGTALIAVLGSESINGLGFSFLCPVGVSALTLIGLGVIVNNIHPARRHAPKEGRWW